MLLIRQELKLAAGNISGPDHQGQLAAPRVAGHPACPWHATLAHQLAKEMHMGVLLALLVLIKTVVLTLLRRVPTTFVLSSAAWASTTRRW
jgi:hypothetical protein